MNRLKIYTSEINRKILDFLGFEKPKIIVAGNYDWRCSRSHFAYKHYDKQRKLFSPVSLELETNLDNSLKSEYFMHRVLKILSRRFFEKEAKICKEQVEFLSKMKQILKLDREDINEESLKVSFYGNFQVKAFRNYEIGFNKERNEILCEILSRKYPKFI